MSAPAVQLSLTEETCRLSSVTSLARALLWASRARVQKLLLRVPRLIAILQESISRTFSRAESVAAAVSQSSGAEDER